MVLTPCLIAINLDTANFGEKPKNIFKVEYLHNYGSLEDEL